MVQPRTIFSARNSLQNQIARPQVAPGLRHQSRDLSVGCKFQDFAALGTPVKELMIDIASLMCEPNLNTASHRALSMDSNAKNKTLAVCLTRPR